MISTISFLNFLYIYYKQTTSMEKETSTFETNWEQYKNMAYKLYLSFNIDSSHREDMIQCSRIGLHKAIETFKEGAGSTFTSWVWTFMRKEMIDYINQNIRTIRIPVNQIYNKERESQPTDKVYSLDDTYLDTGESIYSTIEYEEEEDNSTDDGQELVRALLKKHLTTLNERHQSILSMRYIDEMNLDEIAANLNVTRQAVAMQHDNAIKKLQQLFKVEQINHNKFKRVKEQKRPNKK